MRGDPQQSSTSDSRNPPRRSLVVSLHDVSPRTMQACDVILRDLAAAGTGRNLSLLVIPNHHGNAPVHGNETFRAWILPMVGAGSEAVQHGYFHRRRTTGSEGPMARAITRHYTAGEGEFFDLSEPDAADLLRRGKEDLAWCGLHPAGFIAPAWLLGEAASVAVRDSGFAYTTRLGSVETFRGAPRVFRSQSLVWSVRAGWRRMLSLAWNAALFRALARAPLLRIGIHPPDWEYPAIRTQILALVRRALAGRRASTYEEWVSRNLS